MPESEWLAMECQLTRVTANGKVLEGMAQLWEDIATVSVQEADAEAAEDRKHIFQVLLADKVDQKVVTKLVTDKASLSTSGALICVHKQLILFLSLALALTLTLALALRSETTPIGLRRCQFQTEVAATAVGV